MRTYHPIGDLWARFRDGFVSGLNAATDQQLATAWSSQTSRTAFYRHVILPPIADDLGLKMKNELFTVDFAMMASSTKGREVPVVFIESENYAVSASDEVRKLSVLGTPLRVLITVIAWADDVWKDDPRKRPPRRRDLLPDWQCIVHAQNEVWPQSGWLGVIVGEKGPDNDPRLRFYTLALGPDGEIRDREATRVDRKISW